MTPRIQPVAYPGAVETDALLEAMMPPASPVPPLRLFRTLARNLELARATHEIGRYLLGRELSLPRRERELVIHRVCARCGADYEWRVHATSWGERAGLSPAQLAAILHGDPADPAFSDRDRVLVRAVDELHDTSSISDDLWAELARHWADDQVLDLLVLVGWYHAISYVVNAARVEPEAWSGALPAETA